MAKRSPILGYNHNVRYRGLIFHVQTEDSGVMSPHLFTHMFYGGVIVSTRKLVYDAGSAEDSIKSLMQAQHKAVLKDLKRGMFDDKIDEYLGGTEGLLPRGDTQELEDRPSEPQITIEGGNDVISEPHITIEPGSDPQVAVSPDATQRTPVVASVDTTQRTPVIEELEPDPEPKPAVPPPIPPRRTPPAGMPVVAARPNSASTPAAGSPVVARPNSAATPSAGSPAVPRAFATPAAGNPMVAPRTITTERKSAPSAVRSTLAEPPPPSNDIDPPTDLDGLSSVIAASSRQLRPAEADDFSDDSSPRSEPDIEILRLEMEEAEDVPPPIAVGRRRSGHDTDINLPHEARNDAERSRPTESIPPLPPPPDKRTGDRSAVGAASLPPVRPLARPALTTPTVMSRPVTPTGDQNRDAADAIEVYAPPPASIEPPPGAVERPGAYAQHNSRRSRPHTVPQEIPLPPMREVRASSEMPPIRERNPNELPPMREPRGKPDEQARERKDSNSIPAGLGRPRPLVSPPAAKPGTGPIPRQIKPEPSPKPAPQAVSPATTQPIRSPVPAPVRTASPSGAPRPGGPLVGRTPTPNRTAPRAPNPASGVVMTRPAVIVGAPPKPTVPRVRKAREEEGRGFGQGLISEKSLDEVILAYLSEDADEK